MSTLEPVAVVGVSALLPGSPDAASFWRNVVDGRDLITDVPSTHWLPEDYYSPDPAAEDKVHAVRGGFLPEVDFDTLAFGVPPATVPLTDSAQLLALLTAQQLFADLGNAGLSGVDRDRVSVILGSSSTELLNSMSARVQRPVWLRALRESGVGEDQAREICDRIAGSYVPWREDTFPGLLGNVVAGRIANKFDLHGTNCTVDAACASSLAGIAAAVNELTLHKADLVVTGGVDTLNDIVMFMCFAKTKALSLTGDCRPFAADADGTLLSEGLGMVALKRLSDAERDGDQIYAVIRGVGTASDGHGAAIYAPVAQGQARALRRAYAEAGYGPETVELVEAHGTGTVAGDQTEFLALDAVFRESGRTGDAWCALGSVKSQIGHAKAAAGAAGLLKTVLALHHKVLPPTIKVGEPSPALPLADSPLYLNTRGRPWVRDPRFPRRASVSSFGFGGTDYHLTLEEYRPAGGGRSASRKRAVPSELVLFSASSAAELVDQLAGAGTRADVSRLAWESQRAFRPDAVVRLAVVATDTAELAATLGHAAELVTATPGETWSSPAGIHYGTGTRTPGLTAFLFPGQGSQYLYMGADLAMHHATGIAAWDRAAAVELGDVPLREVVFPAPAVTAAGEAENARRLTAAEWAQPALAVASLALLEVITALGVRPDCLAGHSFGEFTALCAAGVYDERALLRIARRRGELMRDAAATPAAMVAVRLSRAEVEALLDDLAGRELWVANHNAPDEVVVSGSLTAIEALIGRLTAAGVPASRLNTATGFHSPLVSEAGPPLARFLDDVEMAAPGITVFGNTDATGYPADPAEIRGRLTRHLSSEVRFADQIETMYDHGVRTFVEVGPGAVLTGLTGRVLVGREHLAVNLDRRGQNGTTALLDAVARLSVAGERIDYSALWAEYPVPQPERDGVRPASVVVLNGSNHGRPRPPAGPAAALPAPGAGAEPPAVVAAEPSPNTAAVPPPASIEPAQGSPFVVPEAPPVAAGSSGSSGSSVAGEIARHAAEAHIAYQKAMAESHIAFLAMTEALTGGDSLTAAGLPDLPLVPPAPLVPPGSQSPPVSPVLSAPPVSPAPLPLSVRPEPETVAATPPDVGDVVPVLLAVLAEKTGYPVEMLRVDMDLEADLGVDSIKRVEIFAALRERLPGVVDAAGGDVGKVRSLAEVVARLRPEDEPPQRPRSQPDPRQPETQPGAATPPRRSVVRTACAPPAGFAMPGLTSGLIAVTDDGGGVAAEVVAALARLGVKAEVVRDVPVDAHGVIFLGGLAEVSTVEEAVAVNRAAFAAASGIAGKFERHGGLFVTVQDTGGDFGLSGAEPVRAWLGGVAALIRTAALEWPEAHVKAIDCARRGRAAAAIARDVVEELVAGGPQLEVGLSAETGRVVLVDEPEPAAPDGRPRIGPDAVFVVTGGARGVTALAVRALARAHRPRLLLLGRTRVTAEPAEFAGVTGEVELRRAAAALLGAAADPARVAAKVTEVLAVREINETVRAVREAGSAVRYAAVDVTDARAVAAVVAEARQEWGPVTGVVHGAGVLADSLIADKSPERFERVLATKVAGLSALLSAVEQDPLEVVCLFSSVTARHGNPGQSDYGMANEVLNQVACALAAGHPDRVVRSICWGAWDGGMVTPEIADRLRRRGVALISPQDGVRAFLAELDAGPGPGQVVLGGVLGSAPSVTAEVRVTGGSHSWLGDHRVGGRPVVPVALVLDWFTKVLAPQGTRPLELRDVAVLRGVGLDGFDGAGDLLVLRRENGTIELWRPEGTPCYRATTASGAAAPETWVEPPGLVVVQPLYDGRVLFHGPLLQVVREARAGTADAVAVLGRTEIEPAVAAVDGALQLALLWARHVAGTAMLPMAVGSYRAHRPFPVDGDIRCVLRAGESDDAGAVCDLALLGVDGSVLAELLRVRLVRRPE